MLYCASLSRRSGVARSSREASARPTAALQQLQQTWHRLAFVKAF